MSISPSDISVTDQCPLCDRTLKPRIAENFDGLPTTSLDTLPRLYEKIWPETRPAPREENPQGRTILYSTHPMALTMLRDTCFQHRYEACILPLARILLWPRSLDFEALRTRMESDWMNGILLQLYLEPWSSVAVDQSKKLKPTFRSNTFRSRLVRMEKSSCAG